MQPAAFYRDAMAQGFTGREKDFGLYQIDSSNSSTAGSIACSITRHMCQTRWDCSTRPGTPSRCSATSTHRPCSGSPKPQSTACLTGRGWRSAREGGTQLHVHAKQRRRTWSANQYRDIVTGGCSSKPSFDRFNGVYYLGWQKATRIGGVSRSVFNIEVSRNGATLAAQKYRFETEKSFQYPVFPRPPARCG